MRKEKVHENIIFVIAYDSWYYLNNYETEQKLFSSDE